MTARYVRLLFIPPVDPSLMGLYDLGLYGPATPLKIISPADSSVFDFGQPITFLGEKTGNVTNIQWSTNNFSFGAGLTATNSDLLPGTHTITLTGQVGNSPVSNSITVGIRPVTLGLTLNPTSVRPSQTPFRTSPTQSTTVTVTMRSGNTPVTDRQVQLVAAGVPGSGGHNAAEHDNGTRPIPDGIYGVFAAGQGVTNAAGEFTTTYTPTRFGGSETITITSPDFPNLSAVATLTVTVQGLDVLQRNDGNFIQTGGQNTAGRRAGRFVHPGPVDANSPVDPNENHWGTQGLRDDIQNLVDDYNRVFRNTPGYQTLHINDMSLRNGGLFDVDGGWAPDHNAHRTGRNVDVYNGNLNHDQMRWMNIEVRRRFDQRRGNFYDHLNHFHLTTLN